MIGRWCSKPRDCHRLTLLEVKTTQVEIGHFPYLLPPATEVVHHSSVVVGAFVAVQFMS